MRHLHLILLLFVAVLSGCKNELLPSTGSGKEMGIYISCPGVPGTRADQGTTPAAEVEYKVHSLQIWIFISGAQAPLYYLSLSGEDELPAPGQTRRYAIPVESDFARMDPLPKIDVFALANAASVGCNLGESASRDALNDALFSGDEWFGVGYPGPVRTVDPTLGLPMTGVRRNMTLSPSEDGFVLSADQTVEIVRAVSKIRYFFCRVKDDSDPNGENVSIQNITLNGEQIPLQEYLFLEDMPFRIGSDYESRTIVTNGPDVIAPNPSPEKLVFSGQTAASYEQLLDDAVYDGVLTNGGTMYLRESDKALIGSITFTTGGEQQTRVFSMASPGDFTRNHSWTLYGYFTSGRNLELTLNAIPWEYKPYHIDFTEALNVFKPFTLDRNTVYSFTEVSKDNYDVVLKQSSAAKATFAVTAPLYGKIRVRAIGDANAFVIDPQEAPINPNENGGEISLSIMSDPYFTPDEGREYSITLSFIVETADGRELDANSEIFNTDVYRFIR
jgi:hypothetical protein